MGHPSEVQCLMRIADELTKIRKILEVSDIIPKIYREEKKDETMAQGSNTISPE